MAEDRREGQYRNKRNHGGENQKDGSLVGRCAVVCMLSLVHFKQMTMVAFKMNDV